MKKIFLIVPVIAFMLSLTGCLKDKPNTDFSGLVPNLEITTSSTNSAPNASSGGLTYFKTATLFLAGADDPDTITFTVNLASVNVLNKDVNFTLGVDPNALIKLNSDTVINSSRIQYLPFPDSNFTLVNTAGVIKAGSHLFTVTVVFFPSKVDLTKSLALPISILTSDGVQISANLSTIFYHQIGNAIGGSYTQEWIRYNDGPPSALAADAISTTVFAPINGNTIAVASGSGPVYNLSFDEDASGILSNFQLIFDAASVTAAGITITGGPRIVLADPVNKKFTFSYEYNNSSGAGRHITDKFTP